MSEKHKTTQEKYVLKRVASTVMLIGSLLLSACSSDINDSPSVQENTVSIDQPYPRRSELDRFLVPTIPGSEYDGVADSEVPQEDLPVGNDLAVEKDEAKEIQSNAPLVCSFEGYNTDSEVLNERTDFVEWLDEVKNIEINSEEDFQSVEKLLSDRYGITFTILTRVASEEKTEIDSVSYTAFEEEDYASLPARVAKLAEEIELIDPIFLDISDLSGGIELHKYAIPKGKSAHAGGLFYSGEKPAIGISLGLYKTVGYPMGYFTHELGHALDYSLCGGNFDQDLEYQQARGGDGDLSSRIINVEGISPYSDRGEFASRYAAVGGIYEDKAETISRLISRRHDDLILPGSEAWGSKYSQKQAILIKRLLQANPSIFKILLSINVPEEKSKEINFSEIEKQYVDLLGHPDINFSNKQPYFKHIGI